MKHVRVVVRVTVRVKVRVSVQVMIMMRDRVRDGVKISIGTGAARRVGHVSIDDVEQPLCWR